MIATAIRTAAAPVTAVAAPLATAADIRASIQALTAEAEAHETLIDTQHGSYHAAHAASYRRCVELLRACLHHAEA